MAASDTPPITHRSDQDKVALLRRLSRVEGQVRGIARMVEDDRYCIDVLTQLAAARAALDKVGLEVIGEHVRHCVVHAPEGERDARADELTAALGRFVGSR
jgi:CsoR family transcriptional regulator, copper-sensing transcriptional repressor